MVFFFFLICGILHIFLKEETRQQCEAVPTMVATPHYRTDFFSGQMTDVLTSVLVTTIGEDTIAHIGTERGRLLQVITLSLPQK